MGDDYSSDYYDAFIYGDAGKSPEYDADYWEAMNQRIKDMPEPDYTLKPSYHPRRRTPRFSEWHRLPESKRPPQIEGKRKRIYNVTAMYQNEFTDGLGSRVKQIQATINGRNVIVNSYDNGDYVVVGDSGNGKAYRATGDTLDDVIDGIVE